MWMCLREGTLMTFVMALGTKLRLERDLNQGKINKKL